MATQLFNFWQLASSIAINAAKKAAEAKKEAEKKKMQSPSPIQLSSPQPSAPTQLRMQTPAPTPIKTQAPLITQRPQPTPPLTSTPPGPLASAIKNILPPTPFQWLMWQTKPVSYNLPPVWLQTWLQTWIQTWLPKATIPQIITPPAKIPSTGPDLWELTNDEVEFVRDSLSKGVSDDEIIMQIRQWRGQQATTTPAWVKAQFAPQTIERLAPSFPTTPWWYQPQKTIGNIPVSAANVAIDIANMALNPYETAKAFVQTAVWAISKSIGAWVLPMPFGIQASNLLNSKAYNQVINKISQDKWVMWQTIKFIKEWETYAQGLFDYFKTYFTNPEELQRRIEEEPLQVLSDILTLTSWWWWALRTISGRWTRAWRIWEALYQAGKYDPYNVAFEQWAKAVWKGLNVAVDATASLLGRATWTSADTIREVYNAAVKWDTSAIEWLRWEITDETVIQNLKNATKDILDERRTLYWQWYETLKKNTTPIDIRPVAQQVLTELSNMWIRFNERWILDFSQSTITSPVARSNLQEIVSDIYRWQDTTPVWLDILKQRLSDYARYTPEFAQSDRIATIAANAVKSKIIEQVPSYAVMTKTYEELSNFVKELRQVTWQWARFNISTVATKLKWLLRDNQEVRRAVVEKVRDFTWRNILGQVAWLQMQSLTPRWLMGIWLTWGVLFGWLISQITNPYILGWLLVTSPRLVWELANITWLWVRELNKVADWARKVIGQWVTMFKQQFEPRKNTYVPKDKMSLQRLQQAAKKEKRKPMPLKWLWRETLEQEASMPTRAKQKGGGRSVAWEKQAPKKKIQIESKATEKAKATLAKVAKETKKTGVIKKITETKLVDRVPTIINMNLFEADPSLWATPKIIQAITNTKPIKAPKWLSWILKPERLEELPTLTERGKRLWFDNKRDEIVFDRYDEIRAKSAWKIDKFREELLVATSSLANEINKWKYVIQEFSNKFIENQKKIAREEWYWEITVGDRALKELQNLQQQSLNQWVSYLLNNERYPTSFKYYVLNELTKKVFTGDKVVKRRSDTTAGFVPFDAEALANYYDQWGNKEFYQYYPQTLKELSLKKLEFEEAVKKSWVDGQWIKFPQSNNVKDAKELSSLVQWTPRCTANETYSKSQLAAGDFYVFATKWANWLYNVPRVAIRMEQGQIREIRWIMKSQELESSMYDITNEKIDDLPGKEEYQKKIKNVEFLKKVETTPKTQALTDEEFKKLYLESDSIQLFGYNTGGRLKEILKNRDVNIDFENYTKNNTNLVLWGENRHIAQYNLLFNTKLKSFYWLKKIEWDREIHLMDSLKDFGDLEEVNAPMFIHDYSDINGYTSEEVDRGIKSLWKIKSIPALKIEWGFVKSLWNLKEIKQSLIIDYSKSYFGAGDTWVETLKDLWKLESIWWELVYKWQNSLEFYKTNYWRYNYKIAEEASKKHREIFSLDLKNLKEIWSNLVISDVAINFWNLEKIWGVLYLSDTKNISIIQSSWAPKLKEIWSSLIITSSKQIKNFSNFDKMSSSDRSFIKNIEKIGWWLMIGWDIKIEELWNTKVTANANFENAKYLKKLWDWFSARQVTVNPSNRKLISELYRIWFKLVETRAKNFLTFEKPNWAR